MLGVGEAGLQGSVGPLLRTREAVGDGNAAPAPEPWPLQTPSGSPQPPSDTPAPRSRLVGKGLTRAVEEEGTGQLSCLSNFI